MAIRALSLRSCLLLLIPLTACQNQPEAESTADFAANDNAICTQLFDQVDAFLGAPAATSRPVVAGGIADLNGGMNALVSADYLANQHQIYLHLMTLVRFDASYRLQPYLAERWELSEDGRELTFHLRTDVSWHDGTRTTAADLAFTYERLVDPETGFPNANAFAKYESVEVVDEETVRFTIVPHAGAVDAWRTVPIMPAHILGDVPAAELAAHPFGTRCPVGNGPFRFVEYQDGDRWTFAANPAFPAALGGPPAIETYVYRVVPDENTLNLELMTGGIDLFVAPSPTVAREIQDSGRGRLVHYPFRQYSFVAWNSRRPHLADSRVRTALTLGTDREAIVDALLEGFGEVANSGVPPMHWAHHTSAGENMGHNPTRAMQLLDEAGWRDRDGDGVREDADSQALQVEILVNHGNTLRERIAEVMQAQLAEIGVQVSVGVVEWGTLLERIMNPENRDFDGVVMGWLPEFEMDESAFFHSAHQGGPLAWSGLEDATVDELLESIGDAPTKDEERALWQAYQERIVALQPFTYLFYQERLDGVSQRMVQIPLDARGEWAQVMAWRTTEMAGLAAR